jgi:hypothetical protein
MNPRTAESSHLFRKLVLLSLLVTAAAFGLLLLFRAKPDYPVWFQDWFAAVTLAVVAGFGSRWVLNRRNGFIRFLVATATYLVGLFMLGLVSKWKYGIGPVEFWPKQVDVQGLIQVGVGLFIFLLVSLAWKRRLPVVAQAVAAPKPVVESKPAPAPRKPRPSPAKAARRRSVLEFLRPAERSVKVTRAGRARPKKAVKTLSQADLPVRAKRRSLFRGKPKVQIALVEEHRCPFCLEPVSRGDPRGVVECDICHTLHHKDCWEITGVCQVPHYNS